jgi:hypothetical protein
MSEEWALTCYCGLYCLDCIPSKKDLYETAAKLKEMLEQLNFDKYAELKANQTYWSKANEAFKHYPQFIEVLQAIRGLECAVYCREGGGYKEGRCEVRNCAVNKQIAGCWECADYRSCKLLEPLLKFHPNLLHHLELIKTEGVENWAGKRKGHYYWQ